MQDQFSIASIKLLFYRYKDTAYYPIVNVGLLFAIGIFLLFQFVLPQFSEWDLVQREVTTLKLDLSTMQDTIKLLSSLNQQSLQDDVDTVTKAYPFSIDYTGIILALSQTAAKSGFLLSDFSLSIGDINGAMLANTPSKIPFTFSFPTDLSGAKRFVDDLSKILPIAGVTSVASGNGAVTVSLEFYYHGFPQIAINQKEKLLALTPAERDLLSRLKTWQIPLQAESAEESSPQASPSAGTFPPPF